MVLKVLDDFIKIVTIPYLKKKIQDNEHKIRNSWYHLLLLHLNIYKIYLSIYPTLPPFQHLAS